MKTREEGLAAAAAWIGTPYALGGRVCGGGCDCGTLLAEYLIAIDAAGREEIDQMYRELGVVADDWFRHIPAEIYLLRLARFASRVARAVCRGQQLEARPGNLALFRSVGSSYFNHGAIITNWPNGVHATWPRVREQSLAGHRLTSFREMEIFDPWQRPEQSS